MSSEAVNVLNISVLSVEHVFRQSLMNHYYLSSKAINVRDVSVLLYQHVLLLKLREILEL